MWHYGPGGGPGWWVLGSILWVAFWVAVVVVIVSLVRGRHHHHHGEQPGPSTPSNLSHSTRNVFCAEAALRSLSISGALAPVSVPPSAK